MNNLVMVFKDEGLKMFGQPCGRARLSDHFLSPISLLKVYLISNGMQDAFIPLITHGQPKNHVA